MTTIDHNPSSVADSDGAASQASSNTPVSVDSEIQPTPGALSMKNQVLKLIEPWRDNADEEPPFTAGELMVIFLVLHDFEPQTLKTIHEENLLTFKFHGQAACEAYVRHQSSKNRTSASRFFYTLEDLTDALYNTLKTFECPLTRTSDGDDDTYGVKYTISPSLARLYLRDHLDPTRQSVFHFMGLPAELREKIYKMLLVFPQPGLTHADRPQQEVKREPSLSKLGLTSHAHKEESPRPYLQETVHNSIAIEPLKKVLAILGVSRQIRDEALPIFYGRNAFQFASIEHLWQASRKMTHQTLDRIQELHIVVDGRWYRKHSTKAFRNLSPKKLMLVVPIGSDFYYYCCGTHTERGPLTPSQLTKVDGMSELWDIVAIAKRAKHLEIQGPGFLGDWLREKIDSTEKAPEFRDETSNVY
ncbi:hypothetical protein CBER1_08124 [Cercospora berteroae]|uniref:DUF7730 domain-containing protein n=1 Tax=Cercospora berteroae TaxID=357750 RepID=A0A2S6BTD9_9PEZI|nr:hypothetical protein CBER1_08124 [Cercospora berteroae]